MNMHEVPAKQRVWLFFQTIFAFSCGWIAWEKGYEGIVMGAVLGLAFLAVSYIQIVNDDL